MTDEQNSFKWCGYNWKPNMEGGRIIHPNLPYYWHSSDVIKQSGNNLELSIRRNQKDVKYWDGKIYHPVMECATMRTEESFSFGTFSAEIKVPSGKNLWPSFWLSGSGNWPPEIDIMEGWSGDGSYFKTLIPQFPYVQLSWRTTTNVHYRDNKMEHKHSGSRNIPYTKQPKNPEKNFIKYECEWLPDKITFKANGKTVREITGETCKMLTENVTNPEKGYRMNAIFNVLCEDPEKYDVSMKTPMIIRNFKYTPMKNK